MLIVSLSKPLENTDLVFLRLTWTLFFSKLNALLIQIHLILSSKIEHSMQKKKKLGIIGGMGSVAAAYFFERLVALTAAKTDQEYIETFLHNNTEIPDRTDGILYGKTNPIDELRRSISLLNTFNADYILLACLTSHYFISQLQPDSKAVIIDIVKETVRQYGAKVS